MSVRGIFASHSDIVGERTGDFATGILMLGFSGIAPLLAISSGMPKEMCADTSFNWTEDSHISGNTEATVTVNSAATVLTVEDANIWTKNSVVMNQETGEYMFVTAVNSDVSVTVIRGINNTTAAAVTTGDKLQHIGTAFEEGGDAPEPVAQRGENRTNYVQIFKNGWAVTGTAIAVSYRRGGQLARNKQQAIGFHAEDQERSFIFGRPGVQSMNNKQIRFAGGIVYQLETYGGIVEDAAVGATAGNMNLVTLRNFFRRIFDKNAKGLPNERVCFTGSGVLELVNQMVMLDSTYQITQGETSYGIKVTKLVGFNGDISIMTHPLFSENALWGQDLHVYHPGLIKRRVLRDTMYGDLSQSKNTSNGKDSESGYIMDELGWQVQGAQTMGLMRGITTAVASQ